MIILLVVVVSSVLLQTDAAAQTAVSENAFGDCPDPGTVQDAAASAAGVCGPDV